MAEPVDLDLLAPLSDDDLAAALGSDPLRREAVHRWPLSSVERLTLADGRELAYKAQLQPSHELLVYGTARSPLLPAVQVLADGPCSHLVMPWLTGSTPDVSDAAALAAVMTDLSRRVAAIDADASMLFLDLGSAEGVHESIGPTLDHAADLAERDYLPTVAREALDHVRRALGRRDVLDALEHEAVFTNGDLKAPQAFFGPAGEVTVVDWQRPLRAPFGLDVVGALLDAGHDPAPYTEPAARMAFWLQRLHWAVTAQHDLFPAEPWPVFDLWSKEALDHLVTLL